MKKNETVSYEAPQVEVVEVEIEKGFAISGELTPSNGEDAKWV